MQQNFLHTDTVALNISLHASLHEQRQMEDGRKQTCGCVKVRMWQQVKNECRYRGHLPFTHQTQPRL